jgi:hypothetical protein
MGHISLKILKFATIQYGALGKLTREEKVLEVLLNLIDV